MGNIKRYINMIRYETDKRDYVSEFIQRTNQRWTSVEDYLQRRNTLALDYCRSVDIYLETDEHGELIFNATKKSNGETK